MLTKNGLSIGFERYGYTMPLEFTDLNSSPIVAVNCDNRKAMRKGKWHRRRLTKSRKNDIIDFRKKTMTKQKSNLKSIKSYNVSSYYGKNWKVITVMKVGA